MRACEKWPTSIEFFPSLQPPTAALVMVPDLIRCRASSWFKSRTASEASASRHWIYFASPLRLNLFFSSLFLQTSRNPQHLPILILATCFLTVFVPFFHHSLSPYRVVFESFSEEENILDTITPSFFMGLGLISWWLYANLSKRAIFVGFVFQFATVATRPVIGKRRSKLSFQRYSGV